MPESSGRELWRHVHLGTEIAILAALGAWAGNALDRRWESAPWCLVAGATLGFALGLYHMIRAALQSENERGGRKG